MWYSILILSLVSGVLYRLGGWEKGNRLFRMLGVPAVVTIAMLTLKYPVNIVYWIIAFGLLVGALSTYWDFIFKEDNFFAHGFMIALSALPYSIYSDHWVGFTIRCVVLTITIGLWSLLIDKDWLEEGGRGALIVGTLPLLLI